MATPVTKRFECKKIIDITMYWAGSTLDMNTKLDNFEISGHWSFQILLCLICKFFDVPKSRGKCWSIGVGCLGGGVPGRPLDAMLVISMQIYANINFELTCWEYQLCIKLAVVVDSKLIFAYICINITNSAIHKAVSWWLERPWETVQGNAPIQGLWRLSGIIPGKPGTVSPAALWIAL